MSLSTSYSKTETDIKLQRLQMLFGSGLNEKPLKISDPVPSVIGGYILAEVGDYAFGTAQPNKWNVAFLSSSGWEIVSVDISNNLVLDEAGGALAYDTFLELAGVPTNPSVTIYAADDFDDVIGGYGDDGSGVMQWHADFTGSRSTQKIAVTAGSIIEIKSMTNTVDPPYKVNVLTFLASDQTTILGYVLNTAAGVIQTQTFTATQNGFVVGSVANGTFLPECELKISTFTGVNLPTKVLTAENYANYFRDKTLKEKILNGDTPTEVLGLSSQRQEVNLIKFKGQNLFYWSEGWLNSIIKVGYYNTETNTVSNAQTIVDATTTGIASNIFKCPTAFVLDQKVYLLVTVSNPNVYCLLFESTDGKTFTEVSRTLADVSGFKNTLFGNHWVVPQKIDGFYYWFIEGIGNQGVWEMKLMKSTQINTGWQVVGTVSGLNSGDGAKGGPCVHYHDGKFKMIYHYGANGGNLPTYIAYAEADVNDPLYFNRMYSPLTSIVHKPFGNMTDQYADPELCEIDGRTFLFCSIVDNTTPRSVVYRWECDGRLNDILNSKL